MLEWNELNWIVPIAFVFALLLSMQKFWQQHTLFLHITIKIHIKRFYTPIFLCVCADEQISRYEHICYSYSFWWCVYFFERLLSSKFLINRIPNHSHIQEEQHGLFICYWKNLTSIFQKQLKELYVECIHFIQPNEKRTLNSTYGKNQENLMNRKKIFASLFLCVQWKFSYIHKHTLL